MKQTITRFGILLKPLKALNTRVSRLYRKNKEGLRPIEDYENYLA